MLLNKKTTTTRTTEFSKKTGDRGVADSIAALREQRYMTRGLGRFEKRKVKQPAAAKPAVLTKLRGAVATAAKKAAKKKPKKRSARR